MKRKEEGSSSNFSKRVLGKNDLKRVSRGEDMYGYGEQKKPCNLTLTPTAIDILTQASSQKKMSRSEFVEQWLRNNIANSR